MRSPEGKASAAIRYRGLLRQLIGRAERALSRDRPLTPREVHDLRRLLKRSRAIVRLLRAGMPAPEYQRLNAGLRSVARPFAPLRDARVLRDALLALARDGPAGVPRAVLGRLRRRLAERQLPVPDNRRLGARLRRLARRVERLPAQAMAEGTISAGVRRVYRRGRRAMEPARVDGDDALHEWRKQVKYLLHQIDALRERQPASRLAPVVREFDRLGELLGSDHDLAVLARYVAEPGADVSPHARAAILGTLARRRNRLQARSFALGGRLYRRKPDAFVRKLVTRKGG